MMDSKLTRLGYGAAAMLALTSAAAVSSGNNLLYLLFGALAAAFLLSWGGGRWNVRSLQVHTDLPDQIFCGSEFLLKVVTSGNAPWGLISVWMEGSERRSFADRLKAGESKTFELPYRFRRRGLNRIEDVFLYSSFPFGLIAHRRPLPASVALVLPRLHEIRAASEIDSSVVVSGEAVLVKGRSGDLYGIREYRTEEDAGAVNWKLTAKAGKPLVVEYAEPAGVKVTVRLGGVGAGAEADRRVEEAASACRFYIDGGSEVRLMTPEAEVDYGKGLLHLDLLLRTLALAGEGKFPRSNGTGGKTRIPEADPVVLRRGLMLGAGLAYATLFLVEDIPVRAVALLCVLLPLGWRVQERGTGVLPEAVWRMLSIVVLAFVLLVDWRGAGLVLANIHLVLYLWANRLLHPLKPEEFNGFFLILFLMFFLVSGQTISLGYFPAFLAYAVFAAAWLWRSAGGGPGPRRRWLPVFAGVFALGLVLTGVVFAAMPRLEGRYRSNPLVAAMGLDKLQARSSSFTGFTENVSLGFFGRLKQSSARVMRVTPERVPAGSAVPPPLYLRGVAFDRFDGRRWTRTPANFRYQIDGREYWSAQGRAWAPRFGNALRFPFDPGRRSRFLIFDVYALNTAAIFSEGGLASVEIPDAAAYFDLDDSAYFAVPYSGPTEYRARVDPEAAGFGGRIPNYDAVIRDRFLQVPETLNPRVKDLAAEAAAGKADPAAKAEAVASYLRNRYAYSTYSSNGEKTLEDFLFKSRDGNCEYFATAAAVLLRLEGIPARLVSGFLASEWNEYGRFYDVRQSEAHAWVEAYVEGRWVTLDPTPGQGLSLYSVRTLAERFSRWFDAAQAQWYMRVIGYDAFVQRNTFHNIGIAVSRGLIRRVLAWLGSILIVGAAAWRARAFFRVRRSAFRPAGFYARAQAALERAGLKRPAHWTPREYAYWVASARPSLGAVAELAEMHYAETYGRRPLAPEDRARAQRILDELCAQL